MFMTHARSSAEPDSPYAPPQRQRRRKTAGVRHAQTLQRRRANRAPAFSGLDDGAEPGDPAHCRRVCAASALGLVSGNSTTGLIIGGIFAFFLFVAFLVVSILFSVQRLHDIGWSGWLWLLNLVPFVGSFFPLVIMVVPGNIGANRYGPPPPPNSTAVKVLCCTVDCVYRV